jgi:hypothetical protein
MFFTDIVLFRTNIFVATFVAIPIYLIFAVLNQQQVMTTHELCRETSLPRLAGKIFACIPLALPFILSSYMQTLNEMRLFLWGENNLKQQQTVLEIFERQQEGVLLLKQAQEGTENDEVLFSNSAFAVIAQTKDARESLDLPLFKIKVDEGIDA